jgi:hypothetical protein
MRTRWFGDLAGEGELDPALRRLVEDLSRMLDRLRPPAVAPGEARVDADGSAIVLPHRGIPGCSLVVQVAAWSSSIGCWWSVGTDPLAGPATLELFAEFPLRPDGPGQAVAWLEEALQRQVVERGGHYGVARRREWLVVMDDGYELPVRRQWLPGRHAAAGQATTPGEARRGPESWLLGAAVAAAVSRWVLAAVRPELGESALADGAVRLLDVARFAALFVWFGVAGLDRPARVRVPMLAGLLLATLGQGLEFLTSSAELPSPADPALKLFGTFLRWSFPSLLGVAALACYLVAFLGMPGRGAVRPPWPRLLPVAAGLGWVVDLAVGLRWLAAVDRPEAAEATPALPTWYGLLVSAMLAVAVGLAILLVFVVLDRRPGMARRPARASLAGGVLLVVAWSVVVQTGVSWLAAPLPYPLKFAILSAPAVLAWFAGTALVAVAAAEPPATPGSGAGRSAPPWSRAGRPARGPGARRGGAPPRP